MSGPAPIPPHLRAKMDEAERRHPIDLGPAPQSAPEPQACPMNDEDEVPTAEAIAHAVVAAAEVLGENPLDIADGIGIRCRAPAIEALHTFYPAVPVSRLARWVGYRTGGSASLIQAKKASWWPEAGERAAEAAMSALERL